MYKKERKRLYRVWLILYIIGFLLGLIYLRAWGYRGLGQNPELWEEYGDQICISGTQFFRFEVIQRFRIFGMLLLFATTYFGLLALKVLVLWQGILFGMAFYAGIYAKGMKGFLLFLVGTFPQYLLFIPAFCLMLCWCHQTCCLLYFKNHNIWLSYRNEKRQVIYQAGLLLWIFCIVFLGCLLESYVNPILMSDLIKLIK